jgi:hypothetical protein
MNPTVYRGNKRFSVAQSQVPAYYQAYREEGRPILQADETYTYTQLTYIIPCVG